MNWKPDLSLGNVITILTFVVGLSVGWQTLAAGQMVNARDITRLDERVTKIEGGREQEMRLLIELRADVRHLRELLDKQTREQ